MSGAAPLPPPPDPPVWRRLLQPPDPLQMEAGAEGELLVARVRTVLILLLLPIPFINMALDPGIGTCGKNGQGVPVGVGQPSLRMDKITVGGTA